MFLLNIQLVFVYDTFFICFSTNVYYSKEEKSERPKRTISDHEKKEGQSEMARAAAELVELFDLSQEKQAEKTTSHPVNLQQEMSVDDEVTLPRWQLVQNVPQEDVASKGKKSSSSTSSSSNSSSLEKPSSKNTVEDGSQPAEIQQWQSLISAVGSSSSSFRGQRMEATDNVSTSKKEQRVQNVDMSFLESEEDPPLISKAVYPKETTQEDQSVSPSSLVIDPSNELNEATKESEKDPLVAPGPTQPDMSDDMFRPSITQESAGPQHDVSGRITCNTDLISTEREFNKVMSLRVLKLYWEQRLLNEGVPEKKNND